MENGSSPTENLKAYARSVLSMFCDDDERMLELLEVSVGRVWVKESLKFGTDVIFQTPSSAIRHVSDWVKAAMVNRAPWLEKTDDIGRPRKLLKFSTFDDIVREADRDMHRLSMNGPRDLDCDTDVSVHTELSDGFRMVRLLTVEALDRESAAMQHCIGHGAYDDLLSNGDDVFLSLRDRFGKSHATIHVEKGVVGQISGKQNRTPIPKYLGHLTEFFRLNPDIRIEFTCGVDGFVVDADGVFHGLENLPAELRVNGSLYLRDESEGDDVFPVPKRIEATGSVDIDGVRFKGDIERIMCGGTLRVFGHGMRLPEDTVAAGLCIGDSDITELPYGLSDLKELSIWKSPNITCLPADMRCNGPVKIDDTRLTEVPAQLLKGGGTETTGTLEIVSSPIASLARVRRVNGDLGLKNSSIRQIPDGMSVVGTLNVIGRGRFRFGNDVNVGGDCFVNHTDVKLSDGFKVAGRLTVERSNVTLPRKLEIDGSVNLSAVDVVRMSDEIHCGDALILRDVVFDRLPSKIRARRLFINQNDLHHLDGDVEVDEIGVISDHKLTFGNNVRVKSVLIHDRTENTTISVDLKDAVEYLSDPRAFRMASGDLQLRYALRPGRKSRSSSKGMGETGHYAILRNVPVGDLNWARSLWLHGSSIRHARPI